MAASAASRSSDVATIADLARLPTLLAARGYSEADVQLIAHGNFVRFLRNALPR